MNNASVISAKNQCQAIILSSLDANLMDKQSGVPIFAKNVSIRKENANEYFQ